GRLGRGGGGGRVAGARTRGRQIVSRGGRGGVPLPRAHRSRRAQGQVRGGAAERRGLGAVGGGDHVGGLDVHVGQVAAAALPGGPEDGLEHLLCAGVAGRVGG